MLKTNLFKLTAELAVGAEPPSEFRIFAFGQFRAGWSNGIERDFLFDEEAARSVLAAAAKRGVDLMVDYEHASLSADEAADPAEAGKAAAWFNLELRADGLWAVNVRWTDAGAAKVKAREFRYLSPAFRSDPETGRVLTLVNIAVTNLPATYLAEPLTSASARDLRVVRTNTGGLSFEQVSVALLAALEPLFPDGSYLAEVYDDRAIVEAGWPRKLFQIPYRIEGARAVLVGDAVEVRRIYAPVPGGSTMKTILSALGLPETATEAEALEKLKARTAEAETAKVNAKQLEAEVLTLTGKASLSEAMGVLAANKQAAAQLEQATARVQALEAEKRDAEVEALVRALRDEGKLSAAMEPWARETGRKDIATLKAFAASAPKIIPLGEQARPPAPAASKSWGEMSYAEKAEIYKTDPALYEQMKAEAEKK